MNKIMFFWTIVSAIAILVFVYIYLINTIAYSISDRQKLSEIITLKQSEIYNLESLLLSESRKFNKDMAFNYGLTKTVVNEALVITRDNSNRLTFNE